MEGKIQFFYTRLSKHLRTAIECTKHNALPHFLTSSLPHCLTPSLPHFLTLLGFLSNLVSLRALFWALSSTSYSQLIFLVYLQNTLPLATSMLTTSRLMSIVLLLNSLILLHLLHLLLLILILGCLLIVCHLILPRPN